MDMKRQLPASAAGLSSYSIFASSPQQPTTPRAKKAGSEERGIRDYLILIKRRWPLVLLVTLLLFALTSVAIIMQPAIYRADVLVVLQPASVNASASVIEQPDIRQRLDALREQVESRRTLDEVIKKYDLYAASRGKLSPDDIFDMVRKSITLKMGKSSFTLMFEHTDPQVAADVANDLAGYYIKENSKMRRESLANSSKFIAAQLQRLERDVKQEEVVQLEFRRKHEGSLPEDVPANQARLMALSNQVAQTEANLDGEKVRKRKAEERITELTMNEIEEHQRNIKHLNHTLLHFPSLEDGDSSTPETSSASPTSTGSSAHSANAKDVPSAQAEQTLQERLEKVERAITMARILPSSDPAESIRLKNEEANLNEELKKIQAARKHELFVASTNPSKPDAPSNGARNTFTGDIDDDSGGDDTELEIMREQLRMKELAVKEAQRNVTDLEGMRSMVAGVVIEKARNELERVKGELKIFKTQAVQTRRRDIQLLKSKEAELAEFKDFQKYWSEILIKIQEIEAQRLRITQGASEETVDSATKRIDTMTSELSELKKAQADRFSSLLSSKGELAQQIQEHENIMVGLSRRQSDMQTAKTQMVDLDRRLANSAKVQVELPELQRRYRTVTDQYEAMLRQKMQSDLVAGVEDLQDGERMFIWDPAIRSSTPYKPRYMILFSGGFLFSMGAGVGIALLLELASPKFLDSESLQRQTGLEILAEFKELTRSDLPKPLPEGVPASCEKVLTLYDPWHGLSKQFIDCSCLLFKPQGQWPRVVAVCSPDQGDGKTFVSANLAAALAIGNSEPVLLADANLRSPALHSIFGKPLENGLAEVLEGAPIHTHALSSGIKCDLQLLTAGCPKRHGSVLLGSARFREMVDRLTYQGIKPRIILDTPSLQGGADVDVLLDCVDGVVLVIRRGHTTVADTLRSLRRIPQDKLLGVVFNGGGYS